MATHGARAQVPTTSGSRYLQQLCKHWSHSFAVDFTSDAGTIIFPAELRGTVFPGEGRLEMRAHPDRLEVRIKAYGTEHLDRLKSVVASHLDRFAFREAPLPFEWHDDIGIGA